MFMRSFVAAAIAVASWACVSSVASAQIRPRFMILFDTSGSMAVDLDGIPTFGDGITGPTRGLDTDCDGLADDSRIFVAKEALRNMVLAFGDIEFGLTSFPRFASSQVACSGDPPGGGTYAITHRIQNNECNLAMGPFVGGIGDPTANTGAALTMGNCGSQWDGIGGNEIPTDLIPAACRPGSGGRPAARLWAAGSPVFCTNYLGGCPGQFNGIYTYPNGDVLVGFSGFGWPTTVDNRVGMLKWIDQRETSFSASTTSGNFCNHSGTGDCELRPQGPTPLAGTLRAARDYMIPIRTADPVGTCRPYTVLLLTDGVETCDASMTAPVTTAAELRAAGIPVYVVGLAIDPGGRTLLNQIATAGGTDAGGAGGDTAFFADDEVTLAAGLADIVADSLLVEVCNDRDDNCNGLIDEGFVKYCNRPAGVTGLTLCADPGETVCNGVDDNCDGRVDEGLLNACGSCGPVPTEVCNGLDDDCDRVVDDGCPSGAISFVQPFDTPLTGWMPFGDTWELEGCGPGEVVVGFFGHYDEYLNEVGEHCDTPVVVTDTSVSPHAHSLVLMPAPSAAPRGGAMGTQYNAACPAGMAVVGISGLSGSWIDQLSFTCAELELVDLTPANPVPSYVVREVAGTRTLVALQAGGTGGAPFDLPCPTDSVAAVRLRGALGSTTCCPSLVTTLGLACRELEVSIR